MSSEVSTVDFDNSFEQYGESLFSSYEPLNPNLSTKIFSHENTHWSFTKSAVVITAPSQLEKKTEQVARARGKEIAPLGAEGKVEVEAEWKFGGKDGVEFQAHLKGSGSDGKGNTVEVKIERNSDGTSSVKTSASHETKKK